MPTKKAEEEAPTKERFENPVVAHTHDGVEHEHKAGGPHIHDGVVSKYGKAKAK